MHPAGGLRLTFSSHQGATLGLFARAAGTAMRVLRRALILDCDGYETPVFSPDELEAGRPRDRDQRGGHGPDVAADPGGHERCAVPDDLIRPGPGSAESATRQCVR
ncbi:hypothetical protein Aau02nite_26190 [Amorphoplanes auranticolor]|uniref:Uncharacterized protein n=1 Tax=Actinoplanes auranticolor TaxID=47988 RepID=A0A919SA66_9ACTN|nr:hypothetical protein Aau02nite_26190 [Actinoplanes auranticolor]